MLRHVALLSIALAAGACSEDPPPLVPAPARASAAAALGEYSGTATLFPGHEPNYSAEVERPSGDERERPAVAYLSELRQGLGAEVATLALRIGDERLTTEVVLFPRAGHVDLQATRAVRCANVETGGGTVARVTGDELVIEQLRLEQPCTLGGVKSRLFRFRGHRAPAPR